MIVKGFVIMNIMIVLQNVLQMINLDDIIILSNYIMEKILIYLIAFIIGYTRASRNTQRVKLDLEIKEKDIELLEENHEAFHKETVRNILYYEEKKAELEEQKNIAIQAIEQENAALKKEILNSDEKLDKILKDEWGLKKE